MRSLSLYFTILVSLADLLLGAPADNGGDKLVFNQPRNAKASLATDDEDIFPQAQVTEVICGQKLTLNCSQSVNADTNWLFSNVLNNQPVPVALAFDQGPEAVRYDKMKGPDGDVISQLIIEEVSQDHAGVWACFNMMDDKEASLYQVKCLDEPEDVEEQEQPSEIEENVRVDPAVDFMVDDGLRVREIPPPIVHATPLAYDRCHPVFKSIPRMCFRRSILKRLSHEFARLVGVLIIVMLAVLFVLFVYNLVKACQRRKRITLGNQLEYYTECKLAKANPAFDEKE